ncbi:MAG: DUF92 domain-containing protein [Thermoanaerobaculia bacterium]
MDTQILRELVRKAVHIGVGLLAFAVVVLGPAAAAGLAVALLVFNAAVLQRVGGRWLWRRDEIERGVATGIVAYPASVLVLILIFWRRSEVAAAVWAILAFGDGMATVLGVLRGRRELPWNRRKTWIGSLAYWLFGAAGASAVLTSSAGWQGREVPAVFVFTVAGLAALFAAWIESQPQRLDDNLTVPLPTALVLLGLLQSQEWASRVRLEDVAAAAAVGAIVLMVLAVAAWWARAIDLSGAVAGCLLGTAIFAFQGWGGLVLLAAFVALGSAATRIGLDRKIVAQEDGGRRGARHAVANAGVAAVAAVFAATTPYREVYLLALAGAFAAAASDTLSSEIGQLWGRRTVLITSLRPVPPGTDGGISAIGSVAGAAGSLALGVLGWAVDFYPSPGIAAVFSAGTVGSVADSLLGATLENGGWLDNQGVNFTATLVGAAVAAALAPWLS